jgi:hypothetical protein
MGAIRQRLPVSAPYHFNTGSARSVIQRLGRPTHSSSSTGISPGYCVSSSHRPSPPRFDSTSTIASAMRAEQIAQHLPADGRVGIKQPLDNIAHLLSQECRPIELLRCLSPSLFLLTLTPAPRNLRLLRSSDAAREQRMGNNRALLSKGLVMTVNFVTAAL